MIFASLLFSVFVHAAPSPSPTTVDTTICFGDTHARCFELKNDQLTDRIRGTEMHVAKLDEKRRAKITKALDEFKQAALAKKAIGGAFCGDVVTIESTGKIDKFCLDQMRTGKPNDKRKALLNSLGLKR